VPVAHDPAVHDVCCRQCDLGGWAKNMFNWNLTIVERSFTWLENSRRLSKDYKITIDGIETAHMIRKGQLLREHS